MAHVTIYTKMYCGFCDAARSLLQKKQVAFEEIPVDGDREKQAFMAQRANGRRTVPQIFIGDTHVGGCDDLYELEHEGKLDDLLAG
ncbi:MAG: glutaredoxin 3 [Beijerinckiaceae bacterium]